MKRTDNTRISVYVTSAIYEQLGEISSKTGLSRPKLAALAIQAGLDAIRLATDPNWKEYFDLMEKKYDLATNGRSSSKQS